MQEQKQKRPIVILSQGVANRIAAGEVVERPAAVAKELIENAIDSGASNITVVVQDAGRTLIQVIDDGAGMNSEDIQNSVKRHATSKISRFEDLETLYSFGFRGEALPSIASVSRLEIISRQHDSDVGTILKITGGEFERCEPVSASPGTSISVSHLFFNVPARRKFLRKDATEFKWIVNTFRQFALAFPNISWKFYRNRDLLHDLPVTTPRERIAGLFGDDIAEELLEINHTGNWLKATGFISPPSLLQRNKDSQFLFLNKRPVSHPGLSHTIYTACEPFFVSGGHPLFVVFLEASPDRFDINVHPAKKEVKFADESGVRSMLWLSVRNAVTSERRDQVVSAPSKSEDSPPKPQGFLERSNVGKPATDAQTPQHLRPFLPMDKRYNVPRGQTMPFPSNTQKAVVEEPDESGVIPEPSFEELRTLEHPKWETDNNQFNKEISIWQLDESYILAPVKSGMVFVDQHAAHERILYEKALTSMDKAPWPSQRELFGAIIKVSEENIPFVEEALPLLNAMGFGLKKVDNGKYSILSTPAGVNVSDSEDMVHGIIDEYCEGVSTQEDPRKQLAASFSCRAAIKAHHKLEHEEMQRLIEELFQTEAPEFCPHGRPIYHILRTNEIEKWFKR